MLLEGYVGIGLHHADLIVREHLHRPLPKTVYLLGRQTVLFDFDTLKALLGKYGLECDGIQIKNDTSTVGAIASGKECISDDTFFRALGVEHVHAIDHSDYEGADVIIDLNRAIPGKYKGIAEFIFGGSVLDNIFDPARYLMNISELLAEGGRLFDQNIMSFEYHAYILPSPAWYMDFFVINGYDDCKVHIFEHGASITHGYGLVPVMNDPFIADYGGRISTNPSSVVIIAEKGISSTSDRIPSQDQYRSEQEWRDYRVNLRRILSNPRPYPTFSKPTPMQTCILPVRRAKSLKYLGLHQVFGKDDHDVETALPPDYDSGVGGIRIIEATYGGNVPQERLMKVPPAIGPIVRGNVTGLIAGLCNGRHQVEFTVNVGMLGDKAPECAKDLKITYVNLDDEPPALKTIYIEAEAHGKTVEIS